MTWHPTTAGYPPLAYPDATYSRRVLVRAVGRRAEFRFWNPARRVWHDEYNPEPAERWTHWLEIPEL